MTLAEVTAKLKMKKVGIAGCGGLGSNCAVALARVGLGTLIIADFDVVTPSNLNRQYYFFDQIGLKKTRALRENILRISPTIDIVACDIKLTPQNLPQVFAGCDVIVEAFDLADQKEMLINTILTEMPEVPLVLGLGMAGWGMNNEIHCRRVDNLYICGDEISEISATQPPLAPRVGMVANMQANVVLDILLQGETAEL
jgi:sulfur carrier protein ThiS adenylyltransferase